MDDKLNHTDTQVFAMYLPQFHEIPENSEFWGEGFTDWVGVKKSKPLFRDHRQPRKPIDGYYYDLSQMEDVKRQCSLVNEYGLDGIVIYHYWFNNDKNLLTKPAEIILENKDIDTKFLFGWDNISWVRSWSGIKGNDWYISESEKVKKANGKQVLVEYQLGTEKDWDKHYNYLRPFFLDDRYEKLQDKPVFMILNPSRDIMKMSSYWNKKAEADGFSGMEFIYRWNSYHPRENALLLGKRKFFYLIGNFDF